VKKLLTAMILAIALFLGFWTPTAQADDLAAQGAKIFAANCVACHAQGNNVLVAPKTLKQEALEKFGMNSPEAIIAQVTKGKSAMPAFKGRLTDDQMQAVAAYVLDQSTKGWKK